LGGTQLRITNRYTFSISVAAMLAGCGGSQPPISAPDAVSQNSATATHIERGGSWMLPEAKAGDLLYLPGGCSGTCIVSYPAGQVVGSAGPGTYGACGDGKGNVFIADNDALDEYSHGATQPVNSFSLPGTVRSCGVDPQTGNLAVAFYTSSSQNNVAVFPDAQAPAEYYSAPEVRTYNCGYDDKGDLFVTGYGSRDAPALAELPNGSATFTPIKVAPSLDNFVAQVQWDGSYITLELVGPKEGVSLERITVSGSSATVVGVTKFKGVTREAAQSWIQKGSIFVPFGTRGDGPYTNKVGVWKYPRGGKLVAKFQHLSTKRTAFSGVGYSPATQHRP
jgi:hypothetical protein